ncbi:MAG: hypothetical protein COT91_02580 [Candidatus Doudnabacteria bacterium CG10_big_fil_rev_8_21_14_0_10_41_10]|uniref:Uncharacterized protein n=1 Tax=Candidatus Doudnabacteria bacterium CG10_big_fil_rev_8_21_14_0_10_41_10 TaxID=1974551 RepID=A0A2H0VDS4_9BACT|nr:MAG: hypothetical protein COT91_02580 [Candidatus Doudnabacteria bacterium CG10_big_fil_rev_8_21_14_0_10_41_10]
MKKFAAFLSIAAVSFALVSPAAAFSTFVGNVNDSSSVTANATWSLMVKVTNNNNALVYNNVNSNASSGANTVKSADDMSNVAITTGDTDSASLADSTVNTNSLEEDLNGGEEGTTTVDGVTDDSTVEVGLTDSNEEDVYNENFVDIVDEVNAVSDAGGNTLDSGDSLTGGTIAAGRAMSAAGTIKLLNSNIKAIFRR